MLIEGRNRELSLQEHNIEFRNAVHARLNECLDRAITKGFNGRIAMEVNCRGHKLLDFDIGAIERVKMT